MPTWQTKIPGSIIRKKYIRNIYFVILEGKLTRHTDK